MNGPQNWLIWLVQGLNQIESSEWIMSKPKLDHNLFEWVTDRVEITKIQLEDLFVTEAEFV